MYEYVCICVHVCKCVYVYENVCICVYVCICVKRAGDEGGGLTRAADWWGEVSHVRQIGGAEVCSHRCMIQLIQ